MSSPTDELSAREFTMIRVFDAPRELVFKVWTNPKYVALWWGIDGATNVRCELDVRPGGAWRIDMRTAGGVVFPNGGVFIEVVTNRKLVYSDLPDPASPLAAVAPPGARVNIVLFEDDKAGGTRVSLTVRADSAAACEQLLKQGMREGIGQALNRLERLLTELRPGSDRGSVKVDAR